MSRLSSICHTSLVLQAYESQQADRQHEVQDVVEHDIEKHGRYDRYCCKQEIVLFLPHGSEDYHLAELIYYRGYNKSKKIKSENIKADEYDGIEHLASAGAAVFLLLVVDFLFGIIL